MIKVKSIQSWDVAGAQGHQSTVSLANSYMLFIIHLTIDRTHLAKAEAHAVNTESHSSKKRKVINSQRGCVAGLKHILSCMDLFDGVCNETQNFT